MGKEASMSRYEQPGTPESVVQAWKEQGEIGACRASIVKIASVLDKTESGRDIKPLVTGMFEVIDRLNALELQQSGRKETPLLRIMRQADKAVNE